jgi:flavin reductase (DIM6/NTAB) family NADH-FMN oxidoreductase RutF
MTEPQHDRKPTEPRQAVPEKLIEPKSFWRAISNRATGSTVVTAASDRGPAGFLGLSATHVCADPPLVLVTIDRRTSALETVLAARHFALNFLPRGANALADMFGGKGAQKGTARFEPGRWTTLATGAPILRDAVGAIDCVLEEAIDRYGVVIAIGRVVDVLEGAGQEPLVHLRGGYWP